MMNGKETRIARTACQMLDDDMRRDREKTVGEVISGRALEKYAREAAKTLPHPKPLHRSEARNICIALYTHFNTLLAERADAPDTVPSPPPPPPPTLPPPPPSDN